MKLSYKSIVPLIALVTLLTGCWKQHDVVSIKSDGSTSFTTEVVITEKRFSERDIEELTASFIKELKSAGWQVEKKWISKSEPFKLSFSGQGNIKKVKGTSSFYEIQKLDENTYSIRFKPGASKGGKSSRSIEFERGVFGSARIVDEQGNEVKKIENVLDSKTYKIIL